MFSRRFMLRKKGSVDIDGLNDVISLSKKILKILFTLMILATIGIGIYLGKELKIFNTLLNVLKVATPFFIGVIIAWLLDPVVTKLSKKNVKRGLGAAFVFFLFLVFIYLLFRIMFPMLYTQINDLVSRLPVIFLSVSKFIDNIFENLGSTGLDLSGIESHIYSTIETFSISLTTKLPTMFINFITSLVSGVGTLLLGLVIGFYLLIDFDGLVNILEFLPKRYHENVKEIANSLNTSLRDFVQGTLTISSIVFVISSIAFAIVKLPSPLLFGLICGITNIIPYIGPWIGGGIAAVIGFTVSPITGILTAVIAFIVQQIDSILLQPLIMGKTMKLHPVTIMIGLLIFGYFFGIVGMILATPIISTIKILIAYFDEKYDLASKIKLEE